MGVGPTGDGKDWRHHGVHQSGVPALRTRVRAEQGRVKTLITDVSFKTSDYLGMINTLAPELESSHPGQLEAEKLPHLKHVIRMGSDTTPGMYNFDAVCTAGTADDQATMDALQARLQPDDAINIQFTVGRQVIQRAQRYLTATF